jgi:hypothetical protein
MMIWIFFYHQELAEEREDYFRAVAPPIMHTALLHFKKVAELRQSFADEYSHGYTVED